MEEIVKARQLLKEQERCAQETLNLCKSLLENIDNTSLAKSQNIAMDQFSGTQKCHVKNSQKKKNPQKVPWDLNTYQKVPHQQKSF